MWKNSITLMGLLLTVLVLYFVGCYRSCSAPKQIARQLTTDSVKYWRDLYGQEHATALAIQGEKELINALYPQQVDSLKKQLGIKDRQIMQMQRIGIRLRDSFVVQLIPAEAMPGDTIIHEHRPSIFSYQDDYADIAGYIKQDTAIVRYEISAPVDVAVYKKRKWFLGRKRVYISATSKNPKVKLVGLSLIQVR